jgi:DNA-binding HxlR family transcriptional regulator
MSKKMGSDVPFDCASRYMCRDASSISLAVDLIGGKWKAVIRYHLQKEAKCYSALRKEMPAITEMTLSLQLKQLEHDGLVKRKVKGTKPP